MSHIVHGATLLKNVSNSASAVQIQNAGGTTLLNMDTLNSQLTLNARQLVSSDSLDMAGGVSGGAGLGAQSDTGGGGGGAIGGGVPQNFSCEGDTGGQAVDVSGLFAVLTSVGGYPTTAPGAGFGVCPNINGTGLNHGNSATGFGSGGGGANYWGGHGGNGLYGGGGGGAAGEGAPTANRIGGTGGQGVVVFAPVGGTNEVRVSGTSYTVPGGVTSLKVWAIGAGGGGAGSGAAQDSGGGGGAGSVSYRTFNVTPSQSISYSLGTGGAGGTDAANGSAGTATTVTVGSVTLTGSGGAGGQYNNNMVAAGGTFIDESIELPTFRVQNAFGTSFINATTVNNKINIGASIPDVNGWITTNDLYYFPGSPGGPLYNTTDFHSAVTDGSYVYMIGGDDNYGYNGLDYMTVNNHIYSAQLNGDGTTGAWTDLGALPNLDGNDAPRGALSIYASSGYIYYVTSSVSTNNADDRIYSAVLNGDGTVGTWSSVYDFTSIAGICDSFNPFGSTGQGANACHFGTSIIDDDYLYIFMNGGGWTGSGNDGLVLIFSLNGSGGATAIAMNNTLADDIGSNWGEPPISVTSYNNHLYAYDQYSTIYEASVNTGTGALTGWTGYTASGGNYQGYESIVAGNGYIYTIGGSYGDGQVMRASLAGGGAINNDWDWTDYLPTDIYSYNMYWGASGFITGGDLYVGGGWSAAGYANTDMYSGPIDGSGYVTPWSLSGSMIPPNPSVPAETPGVFGGAAKAYNGFVYLFGGDVEGAASTRIQRATATMVNNRTTGAVSGWSVIGSLPVAMKYPAIASTSDGYTYLMGGSGNANVYYSAPGSPHTFTQVPTNTIPKTLFGAAGASMNGRIYVAGGASLVTGGTYSDTTYYATPTGGTTTAWTSMANLPAAIALTASTAANNNYMYVIGGYNGTTAQTAVYYGRDNGSGITSWTTSSNPLPQARFGAQAVAYGDFIYVIGGHNGTAPVDTVYYARINSNGSTSAWQTLGSLPDEANLPAAAVDDYGTIYVLGGVKPGGISSEEVFGTTVNRIQTTVTGNLTLSGSATLGASITDSVALQGQLLANNSSTSVTATTTGTGTNTTTVNFTAVNGFANNDVIFIDNSGQDYYTRIVSGGGTTSVTVSPAVTFESGRTVRKYNVQNIGATSSDYTNLNNRFFQGYFLGGVAVGTGTTTLSDARLASTGTMNFNSTNYIFQNSSNSTTAFQVQNSSATSMFIVNTTNGRVEIGTASSTPTLLILGVKNTLGDPSCVNGGVYYNSSSNQAKVCINSQWTAIGVPTVTSLPGSPANGDEVYYQFNRGDGTNAYWHLRYNSSSTYWDYVGGPSMYRTDTTNPRTTASNVFQCPGAASITAPLQGDYEINFGDDTVTNGVAANNTTRTSVAINGVPTGGTTVSTLAGAGGWGAVDAGTNRLSINSGQTFSMCYRSDSSQTANWWALYLRITPTRVR